MTCPTCHEASPAGARFCSSCGTRLGADAPPRPGRFCVDCGQPLPAPATRHGAPGAYTPKHLADKILTSRAALEGERKQVTVMFADVENFTRLGERLDPEDLHALMDRVFGVLLDVVHRFEGTVNQFTGDGVMALFGAPLALEDHALRAVEAALEVQRAMATHATEFQAAFLSAPMLRIGLNSGRVVVGRIGDDLRMDYTAQGDTVNLAARLQGLAEAGTVAMSATTQALVAGAVESLSLGLHRVKGRSEPVDAYRPLRLRARGTRPDGEKTTPFVGREAESARLVARLADVRAGRLGSLVLVGDAGVGKSRLLDQVRARPDAAETCWLVAHAVPHGRATPYRTVADLLRSFFGLAEGEAGTDARARITAGLAVLGDEARALEPALSWLLGVGDGAALALLSAADRKAAITHALDELLRRAAAARPCVLVFEGCQWLDPVSEEFLAGALYRLDAPVLFVFTCRPDDAGGAALALPGEHLRLEPLGPDEARALVAALAPDMSAELQTLVADRTGGNPLFIEEVTRTVAETGAARIPPSVEDVLMARIDRLPAAAKTVLQTAAVVGRQCPLAVLERVVADPAALAPALDTLAAAGLLHRAAGGDLYTWAQPLAHEVTYEGLLHQHRKTLHRTIGEALEALYGARLSDHVEELARHFASAEAFAPAVRYHHEAGRKAAGLAANVQAAAWLARARELLDRLPDDAGRVAAIVDVDVDLCRARFQLGELDEVHRLGQEAEQLAERLRDAPRLAQVYAYLGNYHYMKGEPDLAIRYGRRCLALGEDAALAGTQRAARQYLGTSYHALGEYGMAEEILTDQLAALETGGEYARLGPVNLAYVSSASWLAFTFVEIGDFRHAHEAAARAARAAAAAGHPYARAIASTFTGLAWLAQGHVDRAHPALATGVELCVEHQLAVWRPVAGALLGHAEVLLGKVDGGLDRLRESTALAERLGVQAYRALWVTLLADALLATGRAAEAVDVAARALGLATEHKEEGNHTRALAVLGRAQLALGPPGFLVAGEHLRQALEQAERLRMRPLLAACYAALATLSRRQGDDARADGFRRIALALAAELDLRLSGDLVAPA